MYCCFCESVVVAIVAAASGQKCSVYRSSSAKWQRGKCLFFSMMCILLERNDDVMSFMSLYSVTMFSALCHGMIYSTILLGQRQTSLFLETTCFPHQISLFLFSRSTGRLRRIRRESVLPRGRTTR